MEEHENHAGDVQMRQTDESQWMMSQMSHTKQLHKSICRKQLHKSIAQINHTRLDDIMTKKLIHKVHHQDFDLCDLHAARSGGTQC